MPLNLDRIRALCFDVDGTLSDTDDLYVSRLVRLLTPVRAFLPNHDPLPLARRIVMGLESPGNFLYGLADRLGLDDHLFNLSDWVLRHTNSRRHSNFWLIPGAARSIQQLGVHFPLAIVSARGASSTLAFLEQYGLESHFSAIATAQTCRRTKPFPDPIHWAAQQMQVDPGNCVMIGDTTVDMRAALAAGAQKIAVLSGFGLRNELQRSGADLILNSVAELPEKLLEYS